MGLYMGSPPELKPDKGEWSAEQRLPQSEQDSRVRAGGSRMARQRHAHQPMAVDGALNVLPTSLVQAVVIQVGVQVSYS